MDHVLSPHPPFVIAADGSPINPDDPYTLLDADDFRKRESTRAYLDGYREQLAYLNRLVPESVEGILEQSAEPPIIILAGDHGSGVLTEHHSLEATNVKERFSILDAYYLPGEGEGGLYPSITPLNAFRVTFTRYFGTDLPLLPDLSFFAEGDVFDQRLTTFRIGDLETAILVGKSAETTPLSATKYMLRQA